MVTTLLGVIEEVVVLQYTQINCNLLEIKPMTVEHIYLLMRFSGIIYKVLLECYYQLSL